MLLEESATLFDALLDHALRRFPSRGTEDTVRAAQFVLPTIAKVPDAMLRSEYVRLLAERLQLDERAVAAELAKTPPRSAAVPSRRRDASPVGSARMAAGRAAAAAPSATHGAERLLTALVLEEPFRWQQAVEAGLSLEEIADPSLQRILTISAELEATRPPATPAQIVSRLPEPALAALIAELVELARSVSSTEAAWRECLRRLGARARKRRLTQLQEQIRLAHAAGREADVQRLLAQHQQDVSAAAMSY